MEKFAGQYELVKQENFIEHLVAIGLSKDRIPADGFAKQPLGIVVDGNKISFTNPMFTSSLVLNQEVEETRPNGSEKNLLKLEGENVVVYTTRSSGSKSKKIYSVAGSELTVKYIEDKPGVVEATRVYKKL